MPRQLHDDTQTFTVKETELEDLAQADPEVTYTLRPLTTHKYRELQRQHTKLVLNKRTGNRDEDTDASALADALVDYVLVDWAGILDRGSPAPCTRENKLRLDGQLKGALVAKAGLNQIVEEPARKEQSFRPPA